MDYPSWSSTISFVHDLHGPSPFQGILVSVPFHFQLEGKRQVHLLEGTGGRVCTPTLSQQSKGSDGIAPWCLAYRISLSLQSRMSRPPVFSLQSSVPQTSQPTKTSRLPSTKVQKENRRTRRSLVTKHSDTTRRLQCTTRRDPDAEVYQKG